MRSNKHPYLALPRPHRRYAYSEIALLAEGHLGFCGRSRKSVGTFRIVCAPEAVSRGRYPPQKQTFRTETGDLPQQARRAPLLTVSLARAQVCFWRGCVFMLGNFSKIIGQTLCFGEDQVHEITTSPKVCARGRIQVQGSYLFTTEPARIFDFI